MSHWLSRTSLLLDQRPLLCMPSVLYLITTYILYEDDPYMPKHLSYVLLVKHQPILHCLQGLSWGTTLAESGGSAYIAPDATSPLPSMQTPTPVNIEAMLMNVPSSTPARAPRLTLTVQAKNQVSTAVALSSKSVSRRPSLLYYAASHLKGVWVRCCHQSMCVSVCILTVAWTSCLVLCRWCAHAASALLYAGI